MKNILSFKPGTPILGREIREWFNYHSENQTSHYKAAKYIKKRFFNIKNDRFYTVTFSSPFSRDPRQARFVPHIVRCESI